MGNGTGRKGKVREDRRKNGSEGKNSGGEKWKWKGGIREVYVREMD